MSDGKISDATRIVRAGAKANVQAVTVNPPIQRGSTVLMPGGAAMYDPALVSYGRSGLMPHAALREALAELEGGAGCTLYPNGLAAVTGTLLALLSAGDEILVTDGIYNPSRRFCDEVLSRFGVTTRYIDPRVSVEAMLAPAGPNTRLILLESPTSLTLDVLDVPALAAAASARNIITVIDNTWGAGLYFRPLDHGVDISVQALTKYVGGHSDVFMGAAVARDADLQRRLEKGVTNLGWSASPDDAYLMLRGLRTLPTRLARHQENALAVAAWLTTQPEIAEVICPGLPGSRGHDLWKRDFTGQNGLLTLVLNPASEAAVHAFLDALKLFGLGYSWGGFESLAIPFDCSGYRTATKWNPGGPAVRLHIGLEDPEDLIADLSDGLAKLA